MIIPVSFPPLHSLLNNNRLWEAAWWALVPQRLRNQRLRRREPWGPELPYSNCFPMSESHRELEREGKRERERGEEREIE